MLPKITLGLVLAATAALAEVSPDGTCGMEKAGDNKGYTCFEEKACCSSAGYCGAEDAYCLSSAGCQGDYSFAGTSACRDPVPGTTISVDGTCGTVEAGKFGYKCPGSDCCSAA
ncbi:glycoside hydrolase/deacetylase [Apiospora rasikravindrae]|uniref:Glycoside hydrolase/deacetylase n=1 Tax=Apiospora rasikravindrae TaxID=990691 RepID=A0ABR1SEH0_9PEZI